MTSSKNSLSQFNVKEFEVALIKNTGQNDIAKLTHLYSLHNLVSGINNEYESNIVHKLKESLYEYINILKALNAPISKLESANFYKKYIYPSGYQLERKGKIYSKYRWHLNIIIGIIFDLICYVLLQQFFKTIYIPIFSIVFIVRGVKKKKKAIAEGKYYASGY